MKNKRLTMYDDAQKSLVSWSSTHAPIRVPEEQEKEEPTRSTGGVLAKDPPKVKLVIKESPRTPKYEN